MKERRTEKGLSQAALAELSGVSIRMIQKYEQGDRDIRKASGETLLKLAKALECSIEELIERA